VRLSARLIKNYANINQFDYATEWNARQDEPNSFYFQLVDLDQDGLRYMPTDPSYSVQVIFPAVNPAKVLTKNASQLSTFDRSIWKVDLGSTEVPFSGNVQFAITEGSVTRRFYVMDALRVEKLNEGGC
jgi:hypothetical protein